MEKEILKRRLKDLHQRIPFARQRVEKPLPVVVYRHNSLIRRRLGNVNMQLQENKATNLALAVKHIDGLLIRPGETFSIWKLVGRTTKRKDNPRKALEAVCASCPTSSTGWCCTVN